MDRRDRPARREQLRLAPPNRSISSGLDRQAVAAAHEATRALLSAASPRDVVGIVLNLVTELGGVVSPARTAGPDALPVDLSFGVGEPMLAEAEPAGTARMHLEVLLPAFMEDARRVVMDLRHNAHLRDEAGTDELTGLLNRRSWDRRVHQLRPGDSVALLNFDVFDQLTTAGPAAGTAVLAAFGSLLRGFLPAGDLAARRGQHQLAVGALGRGGYPLSVDLERLRRTWAAVRPHPLTYVVGVATVSATAVRAVDEADRALTAATCTGPDAMVVAS